MVILEWRHGNDVMMTPFYVIILESFVYIINELEYKECKFEDLADYIFLWRKTIEKRLIWIIKNFAFFAFF